jgi:GT2 family glycosyltransferase
MVKFSIIIVNFNTRELLGNCLNSLYSDLGDMKAEVWVVDNGSMDGTLNMIQDQFPQVSLISNNENIGFARANNQAMRQANGEIWILLNPDTVVIHGFAHRILDAFEANPDAGVVAPQLQNENGSIQPSWGIFASPFTEFFFQFLLYKLLPSPLPLGNTINRLQQKSYSISHEIQWASGACLAIRKQVVAKVGLLDENIFMYGEDMEWCWRVKNCGYKNLFWPDAKIIHLIGRSSKKDYARWIENYTLGNLNFVIAHSSKSLSKITAFWICIGSVLRWIIWSIILVSVPPRKDEALKRQAGYKKAAILGWLHLFQSP